MEKKQEIYDPFAIMNTEATSQPNLTILDLISRVKKYRTTAPTHTPRNLIEQFEIVFDGTNYKLYIYINGVWKSNILT